MSKILTFVKSRTYDTVKKVMYPDKVAIERELNEVQRLIIQGHDVELRDGVKIINLTIEKFNDLVVPRYPDYDNWVLKDPNENNVPNTEEVASNNIPQGSDVESKDNNNLSHLEENKKEDKKVEEDKSLNIGKEKKEEKKDNKKPDVQVQK